jgi:chloramphenicol O-acetyltransferase
MALVIIWNLEFLCVIKKIEKNNDKNLEMRKDKNFSSIYTVSFTPFVDNFEVLIQQINKEKQITYMWNKNWLKFVLIDC